MWYVLFGKQTPKNPTPRLYTISDFKKRRTAEEFCECFVDTLERRYKMIYEQVNVIPASDGYTIDHVNHNGDHIIDSIFLFLERIFAMENLDEKIDALAQNDEVIKLAEKIGTEPNRLAEWLVVSFGPNIEIVPAVMDILLDMAKMHV